MLVLLAAVPPSASVSAQNYRQFQRGMTYASWWHDTYATEESDRSLEALADTGTNWVALIVTWYQNTYRDTSMISDLSKTPTDDSVTHAIETIHRLGMKVMLKPHIDLFDGHWRGEIEPRDVKAWFDSYRAFIVHYAELAQAGDVEMFCVGTELNSMTLERYAAYWLPIIEDVRRVFWREVTYAANWWPNSAWQDFGFLKQLDYVGIDAYFPLTDKSDPTVSELEKPWQRWISQIEAWQSVTKARIILTEIGYRDLKGANIRPWDWQAEGSEDQQEQADCYEATLAILWGKPWLQGIFWWAWTPYQQSRDYTPWGKLAEGVLRVWYAKPYVPQGTPAEAVSALVAIQTAENATTTAIREGRTRGLDQAKDLLSQAVNAYNKGDFVHSESLAKNAVSVADTSVSQKMYDEAASVLNYALQKLDSLRNATFQSTDSTQLKQQAEAEYTSALEALNNNEFELAKAHANNATALVDKAFSTEHKYQTQQALLREQKQYEIAIAALAGLAVIALFAVAARRRK